MMTKQHSRNQSYNTDSTTTEKLRYYYSNHNHNNVIMNKRESATTNNNENSCCSSTNTSASVITVSTVTAAAPHLMNHLLLADEYSLADDDEHKHDAVSVTNSSASFKHLDFIGNNIDLGMDEKISQSRSRARSSSSSEDHDLTIDNVGGLLSPLSFDDDCSSIPTKSSVMMTESCDTAPMGNVSRVVSDEEEQYHEIDYADHSGGLRISDLSKVQTMATEHFKLGHYERALRFYEVMLKMHMSENGYHQETVASDLHQIATCHIRTGKFDIAQPFIEEAVRLKMTLHGNSHQEVANSLQKLGMILVSNKNYANALQTLHRSLRIYRSEVSNKCAQVVDVIFKIGCIHFQIHEYMAALMAFEEALEIDIFLMKSKSKDLPSIGRVEILSHTGFVKIKLKQYGDAIIFFDEALLIQRATFGALHIDTLRILDSIAFAYVKNQNFSKAIESYKAMIDVQHNMFGPNCGSKTLSKMSMVFEQMHSYEEALSCRKRVLLLQEKKFGLDHEITAKTKGIVGKLSQCIEANRKIDNWV